MVQRLEKICDMDSLKVGGRYNLSCSGHYNYCFIVTSIDEAGHVFIKYLDGITGCFISNSTPMIWEQPYSSLELELL